MFKINKKRIIFLIIATFLPIGMFMIETVNYNSMDSNNRTFETMATPVDSKTIVIDAGHGGEDGGAVSKNGVSEAHINLQIALKLQKLLEQSGAKVILTRSDDNAIYDEGKKTLREKKVSDIKNRVKIGNNSSADIMVGRLSTKRKVMKERNWQQVFK